MELDETSYSVRLDGSYIVETTYEGFPKMLRIPIRASGWVCLESTTPHNYNGDYAGLTFWYPEEKIDGMTWMGNGPFGVWRNRDSKTSFGVWNKKCYNTVTGGSVEKLEYPGFKGYHSGFYWSNVEAKEVPVTFENETPYVYFGIVTPQKNRYSCGGVSPVFSEGAISFLYAISGMGPNGGPRYK